jgi:16S rRNA (uracil1498-N3)-methyltransferase
MPNTPRLFVQAALAGQRLLIDDQEAHYLAHVLRLKAGDPVVVFNGQGEERLASVETLARHRSTLALGEPLAALPESALEITLIQALIKNDAMDLVVQKATELGVTAICAVKTDFSVVKLDASRSARRIEHWNRIARSACEQSGRHRPPTIEFYPRLADCLASLPAAPLRAAFDPQASAVLMSMQPAPKGVCLLAGPEGGFGPGDHRLMDNAGFVRVRLGPRTLRAETASICGCALAQWCWGDLA